jgi:hypothetical protein
MKAGQTLQHASTALEELSRRAKLQADELSLIVHRLERLRRDIDQHLYREAGMGIGTQRPR